MPLEEGDPSRAAGAFEALLQRTRDLEAAANELDVSIQQNPSSVSSAAQRSFSLNLPQSTRAARASGLLGLSGRPNPISTSRSGPVNQSRLPITLEGMSRRDTNTNAQIASFYGPDATVRTRDALKETPVDSSFPLPAYLRHSYFADKLIASAAPSKPSSSETSKAFTAPHGKAGHKWFHLPTRWDAKKCCDRLEMTANGLTVSFRGTSLILRELNSLNVAWPCRRSWSRSAWRE